MGRRVSMAGSHGRTGGGREGDVTSSASRAVVRTEPPGPMGPTLLISDQEFAVTARQGVGAQRYTGKFRSVVELFSTEEGISGPS